ncbi:MAG: hypothetical protein QME74_10460 [Candidatus Edwardsbacteria bacterium]|nr:hypothetical protein [Candidatus Edwardsbacteria bacterium]
MANRLDWIFFDIGGMIFGSRYQELQPTREAIEVRSGLTAYMECAV